jgi:hypothetical protein
MEELKLNQFFAITIIAIREETDLDYHSKTCNMLQQEHNLNKELCKMGITVWFLQLHKLSFHTHVHHIQASSSTVVMCQLSNFIFLQAYIQQGIDQS